MTSHQKAATQLNLLDQESDSEPDESPPARRRSAFDTLGFRPTISQLQEEVQTLYTADQVPWIVGYSGAKDSTATLQLIWTAIADLPPAQRRKPVHVISTDTLVENPIVSAWVSNSIDFMRRSAKEQGTPFEPRMLRPKLQDRFWVNLIGRGYPAPRPKFRWCTERLKIRPSNSFIGKIVTSNGEAILSLGARKTESVARARVFANTNRFRIRDRLSPSETLPGCMVYTPIEDWTNDDVWLYLNSQKNPWGLNNKELMGLYAGASPDGECPLVVDASTPSCGDSRFGCWVCTLVEKDKSMTAMIQNDADKEWLMPLLDLRNDLDARNQGVRAERASDHGLRDFRRMTGAVQIMASGEPVPGPYTQEARGMWLKKLLQAQTHIRRHGPPEVRNIELISLEELQEIRRTWVIDKHELEDSLPQVYRESTGEDYPGRPLDDNLMLGAREMNDLRELCGGDRLHYELTREASEPDTAAAQQRSASGAEPTDRAGTKAPFLRRPGRRHRTRPAPGRGAARLGGTPQASAARPTWRLDRRVHRGADRRRPRSPGRRRPMILDQLVIENFGVYGGLQEANLRPEPDRPIVLFGGMNGGGKTTLLDAIQLALYGPKARLSNRGRLPYRDYLRDSIHRGADPGEGASITLRYRRHTDGEEHSYELQRSWRLGVKGIEKTLRVLRDGLPDSLLTDHWDENIAAYLPVRLAHLFFFDGEQIKDLAEGTHAAEIIGSAVEGLLGVDLLERLTLDLKGFERGKREEQRQKGQDDETTRQIRQAEGELAEIDRQLEAIAVAEGAKVNEANQLAKILRDAEEGFKAAGGDLYLRRTELDQQRQELLGQKTSAETELRELLAGPLPLALVDDLLGKVAEQASHETRIRHARVLRDALEERDRNILDALKGSRTTDTVPSTTLEQIQSILDEDRRARAGVANEPLVLDADDQLPARIQHLRGELIPDARSRAKGLTDRLSSIEEQLERLEGDLLRIPAEEQIEAQGALDQSRAAHEAKLTKITELQERRDTLKRQQTTVSEKIGRLGLAGLETRIADDDRERMLKHSARVHDTLGRLRNRIISRHSERIESLMFESFSRLLHKTDLVRGLRVEPGTFAATLTGSDGCPLPIDRLSAGERQLLATAMLWGLARASGRPIPTIIDTPLGRLDSSHRRNLVERYFPHASHQVILLSTDEEIVGPYHDAISPFVARTYLLGPVKDSNKAEIRPGYFPDNWGVRDFRAAYGS